MSIETGAVIGPEDSVIHMHEPPGRSTTYLPDSQSLWDIVWENRARLVGIAHTHPGSGYPGPSRTDLTTFEAMEKGLGKRLKWWILSSSHSVAFSFFTSGSLGATPSSSSGTPPTRGTTLRASCSASTSHPG